MPPLQPRCQRAGRTARPGVSNGAAALARDARRSPPVSSTERVQRQDCCSDSLKAATPLESRSTETRATYQAASSTARAASVTLLLMDMAVAAAASADRPA